MLRFSDRLTSTSTTSAPAAQLTPFLLIQNSDDASTVITTDAPSRADHEYVDLVELLGLHQTVKVLETEYIVMTGGDSRMAIDLEFGDG
jgi:hypothetical protein